VDEGLALGVVEGGKAVGVGIGQGLAGGTGGFGFVLAAEGVEAGLQPRTSGPEQPGPSYPQAILKPPRGHPEAIWWPTGRHPEATLRLP
jgi:hypothetical protein